MVITVSGTSGSGTTTLCQKLAKELKLNYIYAGKIIRELAKEKRMDIVEYGLYMLDHPEIDLEVDQKIIAAAKKGKALLEGRMSGFMLHMEKIKAFKILLTVDLHERIKRVAYRDKITLKEAEQQILERESTNWLRYAKLYGIEKEDPAVYDLIVDTTVNGIEEVYKIVKKAIERYRKKCG